MNVMGESLYWGIEVGDRVEVSYISGSRKVCEISLSLSNFAGLCLQGISD